jgi:hypothetical protein
MRSGADEHGAARSRNSGGWELLSVTELLVIGSQAAHASVFGDLLPEALRSIEVDIAAFDDADVQLTITGTVK